MATISWVLVSPEPAPSSPAFGESYAPFWGTHLYGAGLYGGMPFFAAVMRDRTLRFLRMDPTMRGIVGVIGDRGADYQLACEAVQNAFDLDTAVGAQLDTLGLLLQRPRNGASDAKYRTLLDIQVRLLLSSGATTAPILEIIELFSGVEATEYGEHYPKGFSVGARLDTLALGDELLELLRQARGAGFTYSLAVELDDNPLLGDIIGAPVTDPGSSDFISGPTVADAYNSTFVKKGT